MHEKYYAQALMELSRTPGRDAGKLAKRLGEVLKSRGHQGLANRIARTLARTADRAERAHSVTAVVANESARPEALAKARDLAEERGVDPKHVRVLEDDTLVSGFRVTGLGFRFDASGRAALVSLYRKLVS